MNIAAALVIPGWMEPVELEWLAQQAARHKTIVEIGSYQGRSTRALADNTSGVVVACDDFHGPRDCVMPDVERHKLYGMFLEHTMDLIVAGKIIVVQSDHASIPEYVPDMVFLDGSHEYEDVKRDILTWRERMLPGGLLCGHDYSENWPGVVQAVNELLPGFQRPAGTYIWWVEKK